MPRKPTLDDIARLAASWTSAANSHDAHPGSYGALASDESAADDLEAVLVAYVRQLPGWRHQDAVDWFDKFGDQLLP